jgi:hypothetical protein
MSKQNNGRQSQGVESTHCLVHGTTYLDSEMKPNFIQANGTKIVERS